jgi:hypothetical protein
LTAFSGVRVFTRADAVSIASGLKRETMARKLRAPRGTDEANIAGHSYRVDNDQTITVPDDTDTSPLIDRGGFTEVLPPVDVPDGHAVVFSDDPDASCSCAVEKIGEAHVVPAAMVADLIESHGFRAAETKSDDAQADAASADAAVEIATVAPIADQDPATLGPATPTL